MQTWDLDLVVHRLMAGYNIISIDDREIIVKNLTIKDKYKISSIIKQCYEEKKYDFWPKKDLEFVFYKRGLLDKDYSDKIQKMHQKLDDLKLDLYLSGPRVEQGKRIRAELERYRIIVNDYFSNISRLLYYSLDSVLDRIRTMYSIYFSCHDLDNNLVFNLNNIDYPLFQKISQEIQDSSLTVAEIRKIARSNDWRSYWSRGKESCFDCPIHSFSEEQKLLCSFSNMYDNVLSRADFPLYLLEDDDKFDGWLIKQRKDAEDAAKEQNNSRKTKHFDHVFKFAETQEEANNIYEMNSSKGKELIKNRLDEISSKGETKIF